MNHISRINQILEYIETHLDSNLNLSLLADKSALSKYHFHRIFKALTGEKPLKYVEKRRLTRASYDLLDTDRRIIDIALDFGFGSHESFSRAFKKMFLLTPSKFRKIKPEIRYNDKVEIGHLDLKLSHGKVKPNPTIIHRPPFSIVGLLYTGHDANAIYQLWEKFWKMDRSGITKDDKQKTIGACFHDIDMRNNERFEYYAGYEMKAPINLPKVFKRIDIPENHYAVFIHKGPVENIEKTYDQIYGNWLPRSEYTPTMDLDICVMDNLYPGNHKKSNIEILIPVTR